jgi:DNA-directed RNA polymerase subunit RPC12/RpoP
MQSHIRCPRCGTFARFPKGNFAHGVEYTSCSRCKKAIQVLPSPGPSGYIVTTMYSPFLAPKSLLVV